MLPDERLAEALAVLKVHGADAERFVAERIGALAVLNDLDGIERWQAIAEKLDGFLRPPGKV